jgi:hypothetical protein
MNISILSLALKDPTQMARPNQVSMATQIAEKFLTQGRCNETVA